MLNDNRDDAARHLRVGMRRHDGEATTLRFSRCLQKWRMADRSGWRDELAVLDDGTVDVLLPRGGWYGVDRTPRQDRQRFTTTAAQRRRGEALRRFVRHGGSIVGDDWDPRLGAVLAADARRGRAVAISPHPERTENDRGRNIPDEPLMPAEKLLRHAPLWPGCAAAVTKGGEAS